MPIEDPGSKPSWRVMLSNIPLKYFQIVSTNKVRRARIISGTTFGKTNYDIIKYIQSHIFVFGIHSDERSNRFTKEDLGMDKLGFEVLLTMMNSTGYKYAIIVPNMPDYTSSVEISINKYKKDSNDDITNYISREHIFISNHKDIKINTPIPEYTHQLYNPTKAEFLPFDPKDAIRFAVLNINKEDKTLKIKNTPKEKIELENTHFHDIPGYKRKEKGKEPATYEEGDVEMTSPGASSSSNQNESEILVCSPDVSIIKSKSKSSGRSPPSNQGNSGNGEEPRYQEENPNVTRVLFDENVNNLDSLYNDVINKIGNKYINPKFRFNMNPKLLNHSPFVTNIHLKNGRKNIYEKEIQKKIEQTNTFKKFFEY